MEVPEGISAQKNQVCKLQKAIYGLKQSARCWFEKFDLVLKGINFKNSEVDRCLYFLDKGNIEENIYIILYVDDVVIITGNINTIKGLKIYLKQQFEMSDLNEINIFLGIRVKRDSEKLTLDQSSYLKSLLLQYNMSLSKAVTTPFPPKLDYQALNSDEFHDVPCKSLIGSLMYAMLCTRPDICAAISILSRYQTKNNIELWRCFKRVLRYIKGSINIKLTFQRCNFKEVIFGFVDADWGGDEITRKSTTGYVFKAFDKCVITWNTRKQTSVATSSTEAEYMALYERVTEAIWLKSVLSSVNYDIVKPISIYEDNQSCMKIAQDPTNHKRTKHIDIKFHFIREQTQKQIITLKYVPTVDQLADAFTKAVPQVKFLQTRSDLGLIE